MYDTSVRVPCIASQPGRIPAGRTSEALLSGYDLFPTLVEYAGIRCDSERPKPGRSLRGVLDGRDDMEEAPVVVFDEYGPVRMVRTRDWKYVHRHPDGPHEVFDLAADPRERPRRVTPSCSTTRRTPASARTAPRIRRRPRCASRLRAVSTTGSPCTSIRSATGSTRASPDAGRWAGSD